MISESKPDFDDVWANTQLPAAGGHRALRPMHGDETGRRWGRPGSRGFEVVVRGTDERGESVVADPVPGQVARAETDSLELTALDPAADARGRNRQAAADLLRGQKHCAHA